MDRASTGPQPLTWAAWMAFPAATAGLVPGLHANPSRPAVEPVRTARVEPVDELLPITPGG